ncbi:MAG: M23 family metallopeptidase [Holosporaceae bacterium]|nr:M23 family metallopeptidase [Holosporaceae bacterium]
MILFYLSKNIRLLCGVILLVLGYIPILLHISSKNSSSAPIFFDMNHSSYDINQALVYQIFGSRPDVFFDEFNNKDNAVLPDYATFQINSPLATIANPEKITSSISSDHDICAEKSKIVEIIRRVCAHNTDNCVRSIKTGEFSGAVIVQSKIKSSFYVDARKLGVPAAVVDMVIKNMSSRIDFRRSLKVGDSFEIMYQKSGLLYCKIITKNKECAIYKFSTGKTASYFFADGEKASGGNGKNSFFGAPLSGKLSISDRFGVRLHPITGKRHVHTGVDFRASFGSPVYAIYEGIVTRASYYSGYGHCIDIRHPNGYASRYGHLSKYEVKCGTKVKKGQIIGRSGSSGMSTGPHVHLELARNNITIDPLRVKMMPSPKQTIPDIKAFRYFISRVNIAFKQQKNSSADHPANSDIH